LVLTVGANGHIAFDEPGAKFNSKTHIEKLNNNTRIFLMDFFDEKINVPEFAVTAGLKSILKSKKIILIADNPVAAAPLSKLFGNKYSPL
jgi:glucosamine-6-phosphate deaminase